MSRSRHQHKKNYYMIIGSKNFKNQTKGRHLDKTLERDLAKNPENADILISQSEATKIKKKDSYWYD